MIAPLLFGCIEAGGTKFVLGIVDADRRVLREARVPTLTPAGTLGASAAFFDAAQVELGAFVALGIASFGPVAVDRASPDWGRVLATPKPGWTGTDLAGFFAGRYGCATGFDTDVNGAALAEYRWGAARGCEAAVYVTVGTGIGGGAIVAGQPLHGARHPEMGHLRPPRHPDDRDFAGFCPFHGDCLEGLASGPAIMARWGASLSDLPADHPAHGIIAWYLAQLVVALQAMLSPQRIIFGGGVMGTPGLIAGVARTAEALANGYFGCDDYAALVVPPALGDRAGLFGALALAQAQAA